MTEKDFEIFRNKGLSDNLARVLYNRNIKDEKSLRNYLEPEHCNYDPFLFRDMSKAIEIIRGHIQRGSDILVFGDYDVDGITSTCIMYDCITKVGGKVKRLIPDRNRDGYGLNMSFVQMILKYGFKLVITVDTGITSVDEIAHLKKHGVSVIITDHHEQGTTIPDADAVIDAKTEGETYPYKELCGAGVAYKVAVALCGEEYAQKYLQLAALATVADAVPLLDENRLIVKKGLEYMNSEPALWVRSLRKILIKSNSITSSVLGFNIGPAVNACGRLSQTKLAVDFFTEEDEGESLLLASKMAELNTKRKEMEAEALKNITVDDVHNIIIAVSECSHGILGIIASRISEKYKKPAIVFSYDAKSDSYTGSGRSYGNNNFNFLEKVSESKHLAQKMGGHSQALGVSVSRQNYELFVKNTYSVFDSLTLATEKSVDADIELDSDCIVAYAIPDISLMEPTGNHNSSPIIAINNVEFSRFSAFENLNNSYSVWNKKTNEQYMAFKKEPPSSMTSLYRILLSVKEDSKPIILKMEENVVEENDNPLNTIPDSNFGTRTVPISLSALGISDRKIPQFYGAGIFNSEDLINYFPIRYVDYRKTISAQELQTDKECAIIGTVKGVRCSSSSNNKAVTSCTCIDSNGDLFTARWFGQSYVTKMLSPGAVYIFCGTGYVGEQGYPSVNVKYFDRNIAKLKTLVPVYKKITGMSYDYLTSAIEAALERQPLNDYLEKKVVDDFKLLNYIQSIKSLHRPRSEKDIELSRRRRIFDSLFKFNIILKNNIENHPTVNMFKMPSLSHYDKFCDLLPYDLTAGQKGAIEGILSSVNGTSPVNALVQGDVGCGKTAVAYAVAAVAVENGYQVCITAPTEILARQHYDGFAEYADKLDINVAFLSGTTKTKERKNIIAKLAKSEIDILFGTHAVFQSDVVFSKLGVAIIDEQHKFGVNQRNSFMNSDTVPHIITMSATPIPRTLAMATFGDMIQVYNIKEKPSGRKDIKTLKMNSEKDMCDFILEQIHAGHQAYIVCPRIDDNDAKVQSVESTSKFVRDYFSKNPEVVISEISGRMKQDDINAEIQRFKDNKANVLISTTIVEVGVNVPNATVIALNSSDKFGLAQAHQLRGRVGRGSAQSYCLLRPDNPCDEKANILCESDDGFEIAKSDLAMRGTGDFIGTSQSGNNKDVMLMLSEPDLYKSIAALNSNIMSDPKRVELYKFLFEN